MRCCRQVLVGDMRDDGIRLGRFVFFVFLFFFFFFFFFFFAFNAPFVCAICT